MHRRQALASLAAALGSAPFAAHAQEYPSRAVRMVVPYGTGSSTDTWGRLYANELAEMTRQSYVVENKPGASGKIGTLAARALPADGYTLLCCSTSNAAANTVLFKDLGYDPLKDFTPISIVGANGFFVLVAKNSPHRTLQDFIAAAKASDKPRFAAFASYAQKAGAALVADATGIRMDAASYKEPGQATTDLMSGRVDFMVESMANDALVRAGELRPLAITQARRSASFPNVPTMAETYPNFEYIGWAGFMVRAETPADIKSRLNSVLNAAQNQPRIKRYLQDTSLLLPRPLSLEESREWVRKDIERWAVYAKLAKLEAE